VIAVAWVLRVPSANSSGPSPIATATVAIVPAAVPVTSSVPLTIAPASGEVISSPAITPGSNAGCVRNHVPTSGSALRTLT